MSKWRCAALLVIALATGGVAPPPTPNFCAGGLCLEVGPVPNPETGTYDLPVFQADIRPEGTVIRADIGATGSVTVSDFPIAPGQAAVFLSKKKCGTITCRPIYIQARSTGTGRGAEQVKCLVWRAWILTDNPPFITTMGVTRPYGDAVRLSVVDGRCQASPGW